MPVFSRPLNRGHTAALAAKRGPVMQGYSGLALMLGALVALGMVMFIATGGTLGGKITVQGDRDLPPVATSGSN